MMRNVGQRDEVYPGGVSAGFSGYTYEQALRMKKLQEDMMRDSTKTIDIIVKIEPIANRNNEFIVHNMSTYAR